MHASAILCNKHAYHWHAHHLDHHKDAYWVLDDALPVLLADANLRTCLSPYEYSMSVMDFRGNFSAELDIAASITHPLQDLHVLMRVVRHPEGLVELELSRLRSQALGRWQVGCLGRF
jgi:GINS complex subunit 1